MKLDIFEEAQTSEEEQTKKSKPVKEKKKVSCIDSVLEYFKTKKRGQKERNSKCRKRGFAP